VNCRTRKLSLTSFALIASTLFASTALLAAPQDDAVSKMDKDAMEKKYLQADFPGAEAELKQAIEKCGKDGCTPKVKAKLYSHLAMMLIFQKKENDGKKAFIEALQLDKTIEPDANYATPDINKVFEAAKKEAKSAPPPATTTTNPPSQKLPASDLGHVPVLEQKINTPVPIFVKQSKDFFSVTLNYKPYGESWKKLDLMPMAGGFGGEIPCKDTAVLGTIEYYIVANDKEGDLLGSAGSKKETYKLNIMNSISGKAPSLPGKSAPEQCHAMDVCPPGIDLPECQKTGLGYGSKCTGPGQCNKGDHLACIEGTCQPGEEEDSSDGPSGPHKKNWLSLGVSLDVALVTGSDLCSESNYQSGNYTCFKGNDETYVGQPQTGKGGDLAGFAQLGTIRILAGYDREIVNNLLIGTRLGFAFRGGPQPLGGKAFMPFHAELRGTYFLGKEVLSRKGVRPFVYLAGGLAQVDAKIPDVLVPDDCGRITADKADNVPSPVDSLTCVPSTNGAIKVDAWKKLGTGFAAVGLGAVYAVSANTGLSFDLKFATFFGTSGFAVSPTLGIVQGF
jgi:hypothetical protein